MLSQGREGSPLDAMGLSVESMDEAYPLCKEGKAYTKDLLILERC